jgi:hypothetical protein
MQRDPNPGFHLRSWKNIPYSLSILGSAERLSYEQAAVHYSGGFFDGKE